MSYCERFTEVHYPLARINPIGGVVNPTTAYVSLSNYHRAVIIVWTGGLSGVVTCTVQQAQDTLGTGVKAIAGKAITPLGAADDGVLIAIELQTEELDVDNAFYCVRAAVTCGVNDAVGVAVFGIEPRCAPTPTTNWDEIVP